MDTTTPSAPALPVGGARADFVAQLGRRVGELRSSLASLAAQRGSARAREDLKRRVHALGAAARVLKFDGLAVALSSCDALLARGALAGLSQADIDELGATIDSLVGLAWGEESSKKPAAATPAVPSTVLVVGPSSLADAVSRDEASGVETERVAETSGALDLARALAPDVVLIDADLQGAEVLAQALVDDPLTEPVPIVVIGRFAQPEDASRWLALGVARVLPKPSSPDVVRDACFSAVLATRRATRPEALGNVTIDELGARLAEELQRGLSDATTTDARGRKITLGEGHEVLAALWSAVARVREIVTVRSGGVVRFSDQGPSGAITVGSFAPDARMPGARGGASPEIETRLDGMTIVVADDDPAVRWFLAGVLRGASATVLEAEDGERALGLAYRARPDLVISDIMMPKLDGFALCQALKRDVELRDVPVILLSWKEDLLQRVRELGADADGYLRKEASGTVALARVREVLRARMRAEARLRAGGEVRGRLDGLTVATLLTLTSRHHRGATVSVRDASFLYEIELRDGAPVRATRTASDGTFQRGVVVLASALGATAGRFVVTPSDAPVRVELSGSLSEQLAPIVARARAAQKLLSSAGIMEVTRVQLDTDLLAPYLDASPLVLRGVAEKLAEGVSPRQLLLRSGVSPRMLEDFLADTAAHGAISGVFDASGEDLLIARTQAELDAIMSGVPARVLPRAPRLDIEHKAPLTPAPAVVIPPPLYVSPAPNDVASVAPDAVAEEVEPEAPASLFPALTTEAALQELSFSDAQMPADIERSVSPSSARSSAVPPVVLAPKTPRSPHAEVPSPIQAAILHALPPAPIVSEPAPAVSEPAPIVSEPAPVAAAAVISDVASAPVDAVDAVSVAEPAPMFPSARVAPPSVEVAKRDEDVASKPAASKKKASWVGPVVVVALAGAAAAFILGKTEPAPTSAAPTPAKTTSEFERAEPAAVVAPPVASVAAATSAAAPATSAAKTDGPFEDLPLPAGVSVPEGQGMIEIVAGKRDQLSVDRQDLGRGPRVTATLTPGTHDVRAKRRGEEQPMVVLVRPGRRTRVDLRAPWHR